jgi:hypothetical protein
VETATTKGFFRHRHCCPSCGEVLPQPAPSRFTAAGSIAVGPLVRLGVSVVMPSYRCPACEHECVEPRDDMVSDLMKASAHAFRSAHIAPG